MSERCPECDSEYVYLSPRLGQQVCEDCGHRFERATSRRQLRIFLSYGHDVNEPLVQRLRADLEHRGHDVWIDTARLKSGEDWRSSIASAILDSSVVLGFLSAHSVRDPGVCLDELRIALSVRSARIHTILLEPAAQLSPPSTVADIQWLDMSEWRDHIGDDGTADVWYDQRLEQLCDVLESDEVAAFEGEVSLLTELLRPRFSDTKERSLIETAFSPRPWLEGAIETWRTDPRRERTLVVTGGAGTGKSMLAANLLHYSPWAICGVFCEWDKSSTIEPRCVTELIAFKLAVKVPDYRRILLRTLQDIDRATLDASSDADYFDILLISPLRQTIDGDRPRHFIVVDGLDEATNDQQNHLAELLAQQLDRLPPWLGVLVTTRDEPSILRRFSGAPVLDIGQRADETNDDILVFLAHELEDHLPAVDRPLELLSTIAAKAGGRFLYAKLFADNVHRGALSLDDTDAFPDGLDAAYERDFERRFAGRTYSSIERGILEALESSNAVPMTVLSSAFGLRYHEVNDFAEQFGSLVRRGWSATAGDGRPTETLSFAHKSIADWIGDPTKSGRFHAAGTAGAATLAAWARRSLTGAGELGSRPLPADALAFATEHVGRLHAAAGEFVELERFLLATTTPLDPFHRSIVELPDDWDIAPIIDRLWNDTGRDEFLDQLRRGGEQPVLRRILDGITATVELGAIDSTTVNLLVDMVHLGGGYQEAVALCDAVLAAREHQADADAGLLQIATRRLHHSMFFAPVTGLISEAHQLLETVDPVAAPGTYNELLFLIGGNLGVLHGDFDEAEEWIHRSLEFAVQRDDEDFRMRSTRKLAEVYLATDRVDEALGLLQPLVEPSMPITTRYQLYLVGALGEAHRLHENVPTARICFEQVRSVAIRLGIPGWRAHGELGLAALLIDAGLLDEAGSHASDALAAYERIGQAWGRLATAIVAGPIRDRVRSPQTQLLSRDEVVRETERLGYRYLGDIARRRWDDEAVRLSLQFL